MTIRTILSASLAAAFALAAAPAAFAQGGQPASGGDAGMVVPEKEFPKIMAQAGATAGKVKGYQATYSVVSSNAKIDSSGASTGTIYAKRSETFTFLVDDPGNGDANAAHKTLILPAKKSTVLYPATKTGEETDISKDLTLWRVLGSTCASLTKDFNLKLTNVSGRYAHEKTTFTNLGGDTRKDFKDPAAGKKPSFDSWTCHRFELTPKNGAWAAAVKKIAVMVDMNLFIVTRVEFDAKGDGSQTSSVALSEIDIDAKLDDKLFEIDKEYKITKAEPKKEEKK